MIDFLSSIADYTFVQRALVTAIIVGVLCGVIGTFIVLRGLALMGDAISHAVLPGVAISYLLGVNFFLGAFTFGIAAAIGIGAISHHSRIKIDSAIGIVFSAFLALGVILIAKAQTAIDLTTILFGNILVVSPVDFWITVAVAVIVLAAVLIWFRELQISTFDPVLAAGFGLPVRWISHGLMVLLTMVTVAALQAVGVLLVVALLITPAATAYLLVNRLSTMIVLAAALGAASSVIGLYFSFQHNVSSGAAIVVTASAIFAVTFLFAPRQGVLPRWYRARRSKRRHILVGAAGTAEDAP